MQPVYHNLCPQSVAGRPAAACRRRRHLSNPVRNITIRPCTRSCYHICPKEPLKPQDWPNNSAMLLRATVQCSAGGKGFGDRAGKDASKGGKRKEVAGVKSGDAKVSQGLSLGWGDCAVWRAA